MMPNTDVQTALSFESTQRSSHQGEALGQRSVRLGLAIDHRAWLELLANEWWPLDPTSGAVRLGVGTARGDVGASDRIGVVAWLDPSKLPSIDVTSWREASWVRVPISKLTNRDEEIVWHGPIPLFAIASFSAATESDANRLVALAKGFSNIAPPTQRIEIERLNLHPSISEPLPDQQNLSPPQHWNALRGAAAMATWSVPAIGPWLHVLCESLALTSDPSAANSVEAPWWNEPPWRRAPQPDTAKSLQVRLWRAALDVLLDVRLRESWRPKVVLDAFRNRACTGYGVDPASLNSFMIETRALLHDERTVSVGPMEKNPVGLALQLVLLRPTPDRFVGWRNDLRDLPPVVWWTGAMLSGLLRGYCDLEQTYRGSTEGRRLLALRIWQMSQSEQSKELRWPDLTDSTPTWQRQPGHLRLLWDGKAWGDRSENGRGRWYTADLNRRDVRQAAIDLVARLRPSCLRRTLRLADERLPWSGSGTMRSEDAPTRELAVQGEVLLDLSEQASIVTDLHENRFRDWLVQAGIGERLPDPPTGYRERVPLTASPTAREVPDLIGLSEPAHDATEALASASREVPGLLIAPAFISEGEERDLLAAIDAAPWQTDMARRVQHYGWTYEYKSRRVDPRSRLGPLPPWAERIGARLLARGLVEELPDQIIVNEYVAKQGIAKHVDCLPCFRGAIVTISLGESWEMFFWPPGSKKKVVLTLDRRSAVVLTGEAREKWKHEIPRRLEEPWGLRGRRVSLTFRRVDVRPTEPKTSEAG